MTDTILRKYLGDNSLLVKHKKLLFFLLKLFIATGLLYYIISEVKLNEIITALEEANLNLILLVVLIAVFNIYLQFLKWKMTCNLLLAEKSSGKIFTSLLHGLAAGVSTPARVGEYFGRALVFKEKPVYKVALSTLLDKFFPLLMVVFFGSISSILFIQFEYEITPFLTLSLFIALFSLFYFFIYLLLSESFWDSFIFDKIKKSTKLNYLLEKLKEFKNLDRRYTYKMLFVSFLFYLCYLVQYAFLVSAFSHQLNIADYMWAGILVMFAKTVIPPVSLGELGIREGASVYFISRIGESASIGFNASIFLFLINVLLPSIVGFFLLIKNTND